MTDQTKKVERGADGSMRIRCQVCAEAYHDAKYEMCFNCSMRKQGKVRCKKCKKGWHTKDYEVCYDCFQKEPVTRTDKVDPDDNPDLPF